MCLVIRTENLVQKRFLVLTGEELAITESQHKPCLTLNAPHISPVGNCHPHSSYATRANLDRSGCCVIGLYGK